MSLPYDQTIPGDVTSRALGRIDAIFSIATNLRAEGMSSLGDLKAEVLALIAILDGVVYDPTFTGFDTTFSPPSPPVEPSDPTGEPTFPTLLSVPNLPDSFNYANTEYTPIFKSALTTLLGNVIGGSATLLADAIYTAVFDRAAGDLAEQYVGSQWDATDNGARLGWQGISEASLARLSEAANAYGAAQAKLRLEHVVTEATQKREDVLTAIKDGIEFENGWVGVHNTNEARKLETEKARIEISIAIMNAVIASNTLLVNVFESAWRGIAAKIKAKVDLWAIQFEPAKLILEGEKIKQGYNNQILEKGFKTEDGKTNLAIQRANMTLTHLLGVLIEISKMLTGMAQAALSASDVSIGASAPWGYNESHSYCEKAC